MTGLFYDVMNILYVMNFLYDVRKLLSDVKKFLTCNEMIYGTYNEIFNTCVMKLLMNCYDFIKFMV